MSRILAAADRKIAEYNAEYNAKHNEEVRQCERASCKQEWSCTKEESLQSGTQEERDEMEARWRAAYTAAGALPSDEPDRSAMIRKLDEQIRKPQAANSEADEAWSTLKACTPSDAEVLSGHLTPVLAGSPAGSPSAAADSIDRRGTRDSILLGKLGEVARQLGELCSPQQ